MGGFFVTNAPFADQKAQEVFERKPIGKCSKRSVAGLEILHCAKQNRSIAPSVYETSEGWILGFGTFYYRGHFGSESLAKIWSDLEQNTLPFSEIGGNFSFLLYRNGRVQLVTDKSGIYHVYIAKNEEHFFLSSSLLAIAECLPRLTVRKQEVLEFINTETTFGNRTIFDEIAYADAGIVIDCSDGELSAQSYYDPRDERVDFDGLVERLHAYATVFGQTPTRTCADLSGGHDTRTVAAVLAHAGVEFEFNTNENTKDPNDHQIAKLVAAHLGRPIKLYKKEMDKYDYDQLVDECFWALELARNIYRSAFTPVFLLEKAADHQILLGGYGGELLRDQYSKPEGVDQLVRKHYVSNGIWFPPRVYHAYRERLVDKFEQRLRALGETDIRKGVEKIYYFEKMRFWGGSRITSYNQYCYRVHPLLDHALAKHYFDFTIEDKRRAKLQRRIIALFPGLETIPFDYEFVEKTVRQRAVEWISDTIPGDVLTRSREAYKNIRRLATARPYEPPPGLRGAVHKISPELLNALSLSFKNIRHPDIVGRLATIGYSIERYQSKVRGLG